MYRNTKNKEGDSDNHGLQIPVVYFEVKFACGKFYRNPSIGSYAKLLYKYNKVSSHLDVIKNTKQAPAYQWQYDEFSIYYSTMLPFHRVG